MKEEISKKVIDKIKKERITPESKWKLNWKNYVFWILLVGMVLLGALFFSLIIFNITDIDRDLYFHFKLRKFIWLILRTAPFLWIILSILTLVFGLLAFQKTKHGYRYQTLFTASIVVIIISILGILTHFLKINNQANNRFSEKIPHFQQLTPPKELRWLRPEEGLLAGEIIGVKPDGVVIISFRSEEWTVNYGNETIISPDVKLEKSEKIRAIGRRAENFLFEAKIIKRMDRITQPPHRGFKKMPF